MSAPIPSFFKIRCVLVIISILLFFMLIGMMRQAFAADCSRYDFTIGGYYKTAAAAQSASVSARPDTSYSLGYYASTTTDLHICYNLGPYPVYFYQKYSSSISKWIGSVFVVASTCEDPDGNLKCDCFKEKQDLASQCGSTGYTMIDEDTCSGRCNDCVQSAEAQCPSPNIIVWNEDGDCSYNCSADTDGDGQPDIEDPDDDNDGIADDDDPCPTNSDPNCVKPSGPDSDGDGIPDVSDPDADMDGDGIPNSEDDDDDGDGVPDVSDLDADPDGDGLLNWQDDDDDGDGIPDVDDPDADPDGDGKTNDEDDDDDNDGVPDVEDPDNDKYHSNEPAYSVNSSLSEMLKARFQQFLDDVKMSSLFSIPERIKQGVPSGGDSSLSVEMGETFGGTHVVEFSGWSQGLAALNAIIYTVCSGIAIRIIILKR